ncbi:MAG: tRNA1(Val) (adenine(37)-N6)-methyltransferase [Methylovirgula sp.]
MAESAAESAGQTILAEAVTEDAFLGGRIMLRQPARGHRAGSDAVLLAAASPPQIAGQALDIGAGVGSAGLALAALRPELSFGLVENDPLLIGLAHDNLVANHLAARGSVFGVDVLDAAARRAVGLADASAAFVMTNPPFQESSKVRMSPRKGKQSAHVLPEGVSLKDWIVACLALLADGGQFLMIHRPEALPEMLAALAGRAGEITLKPIAPEAGRPAVRLLLRAKKGSRAPLAILAPFNLNEGRGFTREAEAVHRGEALIVW